MQAGVLTREQALASGVGRHSLQRLVDERTWLRLGIGIYLLHDVDPPWLAWAWGGVLRGGDDARLGARAAGHLHGLVVEPPRPISVLVPQDHQVRDEWPWEFVRERRGARSSARRGSPPRISIEDTVLDLAAASSETEVIGWVTSAIQTRRTTARRLRQALDSRARCPHRALLLAILADVSEGAESPLEVIYLREVERRHELPRGRRQQRSGHAVRDVVYEEQALVVELDGRLGHDGAGRFKDMWRDNASAVVGESTLRYGWHDVTDRPCLVARQVAQILGLRGWRGSFAPCSRCRLVPWPMMGVDPAG